MWFTVFSFVLGVAFIVATLALGHIHVWSFRRVTIVGLVVVFCYVFLMHLYGAYYPQVWHWKLLGIGG